MARFEAPSTTWLDKQIAKVSPGWAASRQRARYEMATRDFMASGGYIAGKRGRASMEGWAPTPHSADQELLDDLPTIRGRCRAAYRNIPMAGAPVNRIVTNTAGANGLRPQSKVKWRELGITKEYAQAFQRDAESVFDVWASSKEADHERRLDFWQKQALSLHSVLNSGDCFAIKHFYPRAGSDFNLKIQLIEADRVDNPNGIADTDTLRMGVVKSSRGEPIAYWIADRHPSDPFGPGNWRKVSAFGKKSGVPLCLHLIPIERIGQSRGIPFLAPVLELFKIIGGYTHNEAMAAAVSSLFTTFIWSERGFAGSNPSIRGPEGNEKSNKIQMDHAAIISLKEGERIETANPGRPNSEFAPFINAAMEQIGSRLDLPVEIMQLHFTSSYTAARGALLEAVKTYSGRRVWLSKVLCQPCWDEVITEQIARGYLKAPGFFDNPMARAHWLHATWHGDSFGLLDPLRETQAAILAVDNNISTLQSKVMEMTGQDWLDVHEQRVYEVTKQVSDDIVPPQKEAVDTAVNPDKEKEV